MKMMILKLTPIDVESDHWKYSTEKGEVIVRAQDEGQARALANGAFVMPREQVPGAETRHMIWSVPDLVTCETIDDWDGETDGPAEILYPVDYAVPDRPREAEYLRALAYQAEHQTTDLRQLGVRIYNHLHGNTEVEVAASQVAEGVGRITDWANEVKETGESEHLPLIAAGLRKIADELERQATVAGLAN